MTSTVAYKVHRRQRCPSHRQRYLRQQNSHHSDPTTLLLLLKNFTPSNLPRVVFFTMLPVFSRLFKPFLRLLHKKFYSIL